MPSKTGQAQGKAFTRYRKVTKKRRLLLRLEENWSYSMIMETPGIKSEWIWQIQGEWCRIHGLL